VWQLHIASLTPKNFPKVFCFAAVSTPLKTFGKFTPNSAMHWSNQKIIFANKLFEINFQNVSFVNNASYSMNKLSESNFWKVLGVS